MSNPKFPPGWDEARVQKLLARYDQMDDEEMMAEEEAAKRMNLARPQHNKKQV
jgi:hypothetical protein